MARALPQTIGAQSRSARLSCPTDLRCLAALHEQNAPTTLRSNVGGSLWRLLTNPVGVIWVTEISCPTRSSCAISGGSDAGPTFIKTTNSGRSFGLASISDGQFGLRNFPKRRQPCGRCLPTSQMQITRRSMRRQRVGQHDNPRGVAECTRCSLRCPCHGLQHGHPLCGHLANATWGDWPLVGS